MSWGRVLFCTFTFVSAVAWADRDADGREAFKKAKKLVTKGEYSAAESALLRVKSEFGEVFADPGDRFTTLSSESDAELLGVRCRIKRSSFDFTERKWEDVHRRLLGQLSQVSADYASMMLCGFMVGPEGSEKFWFVSPFETAPSVLRSVLSKYDWRAARPGVGEISEKGLDAWQAIAVPDPSGKISYFTFLYHKENGWGWSGLRAESENLRSLETLRPAAAAAAGSRNSAPAHSQPR
jgi:hypothetical protein